MSISSPGIGSNLDINGIVSKLMQAESAPLAALAKKEASYQAKLSAFGTLSGALSSFKDALVKLNTPATFQSMSASVADGTIFSAKADTKAVAGSYGINITRLAQAQTLSSAGMVSTTAPMGTGKLVFQFGTASVVSAGTRLSDSIAAGGIAAGTFSINGTAISTDSSTNSAKALAAQINLATATTGVTAKAQATDTGSLGAFTATSAVGTFKLVVGGVTIIDSPSGSVDAAAIQAAVEAKSSELAAAGIAFSGNAADDNLKFTRSDGSNIVVEQSGTASGGFAAIGMSSKTYTSSVSLNSDNAISVAGSSAVGAGFTVGTNSSVGFTQNASQTTGEVTIDTTNNSLQGIRDAINKANLGVTATIVSDGSASPYHLVIKSNKTGATSGMKINVQGGDGALANLLTYDPAGTQKMMQTSAAQSAALTVNGIAVSSETNSVSGAIEGVSLDLAKEGASNLTVKLDTAGVQAAISNMVKTYNDLRSTIKNLSGYNADTKKAGILIGDSTVRSVESQIRKMLSSSVSGSSGNPTSLAQIGVSIDKNGTMSLDSSKLSTAMNKSVDDVAALFSSMGKATDSLVSFSKATSATKPGTYDVFVTQLATQGKLVGEAGKDLRLGSILIDNSNRELSFMVDGVNASISLATGSYSATQIASHLQSAINSTPAFTKENISVNVTIDSDGRLNITSNRYGSASKVSISGSGTSVSNLMGTPVTTEATGVDVAGKIGGVAATGSGQFLTGAVGSPAAGLKLQINGGPLNARGTVTFSQGSAFHLNNLIEDYLGNDGLLAGRTDGLKDSIKDLGKMTEKMNTRLAAIEKRYLQQFAALDVMISRMNSTSAYLSQQLAQISNMSSQ